MAPSGPSRLGFQQREIHDAAYTWQKRVETEDAIVVGVNRFTQEETTRPEILKVDEQLSRTRTEKLKDLRARRNKNAVDRALRNVEQAAKGDANLVPLIIEAVERDTTLGEIADTLRSVYGVHTETFAF